MKILYRTLKQPRAYADSYGEMLVELEDGDVKEEVIKELTKYNNFFRTNTFFKACTEHNGYTGNLLLFKVVDGYTG